MKNCWYCYWGWAKPVADIYNKTVRQGIVDDYDMCHIGHPVWEDENFDDITIKSTIQHIHMNYNTFLVSWGYTKTQINAVCKSLEQLLEIPEHERCIEPKDYDGEHPEKYPPNVEVQKV